MAEILQTGFEAYGKSLMIHGAGLSDKEATEVIQGCLDAMRENKEHTYYQKYLSYKVRVRSFC